MDLKVEDRPRTQSRAAKHARPRTTGPTLWASVDAFVTPTAIVVLAGIVSLALGCYYLSLPHVLSGVLGWNEGYDEGVYLGAATRLVNGALPYRDFVLVHPPGIVLLMFPVALVGGASLTPTSHSKLHAALRWSWLPPMPCLPE